MSSPSIEEFLKNHFVESNDIHHTHVSMIQPKGKFNFTRADRESFWDMYCQTILMNENAILGLAEKTQEYMPILVDIDLKITVDDEHDVNIIDDHLYSQTQLEQVVKIYQTTLRSIVNDCSDKQLKCIVLEKPYYKLESSKNNTCIKSGFHLHFPGIFLNKIDQKVHLIPRVKSLISDAKIFENLGYEDSGKVVDAAVENVPWLMYGSRKDGKNNVMNPYKVTNVLDSNMNSITLEDGFSDYEIFNIDEEPINIKGNVKKYLPRILSVFPYGRETHEVKKGLVCPLREKGEGFPDVSKIPKKKKTDHSNLPPDKALDIAEKLLPLIGDYRAEDRMEWITIGWILYNIGDGSERAQMLWMDFSGRCDEKYEESRCVYEWERMTVRDYTLGTLHYYASVDSPHAYKDFKSEQSQELVSKSIDGGHYDIAKILHCEYGIEFICASYENRTWFRFNNHRWEEIERGVDLMNIIWEELPKKFSEKGKDLYAALASVQDKSEQAMLAAQQKAITKIIGSLKSVPFAENIMKAAAGLFYDKRFKQKLDRNPYLIAFQNGVYDLKQNIFRDGRPEDFISQAIPIDYVEYTESDQPVQDVMTFFQKVFPDQELREYFFNIYCDIFVGGNPEKIILFWTGVGDNGKSVTQKLLEKMLGKLAIKFETSFFSGKKAQSGSANPELARAVPPVRLASMEEPDNDEQLNIGYLKKLSGDDTIWARDLFQKGKDTREVEVMFMITIICNKLPGLRLADAAAFNRFRVIPFESYFTKPGESCPTLFDDQIKAKRFPRDKYFGQKIDEMLPALAWFLLNWRKNYKPFTIVEPAKVLEATANYQKQNDMYREYIEERIVEDAKRISAAEIYNDFKIWYRESYNNHTIPVKKDVIESFSSLWGKPMPGGLWKGFRFRTEKDDIDDGIVIILDENDLLEQENKDFIPPV